MDITVNNIISALLTAGICPRQPQHQAVATPPPAAGHTLFVAYIKEP